MLTIPSNEVQLIQITADRFNELSYLPLKRLASFAWKNFIDNLILELLNSKKKL